MSFAYLRFYTGDYFRDTRGLSMAGHGCYFLLLTYCWDTQGPLPLDHERIAGICEARNQEERATLHKILHTYFTEMEDGWYNSRLQREIERTHAISGVRQLAGREGANKRMQRFRQTNLANAKQLPSKSVAFAKQVTLSPSPSPSPSKAVDVELRETPLPPGKGEGAGRGNPRSPRAARQAVGTQLAENWQIPEDWIAIGLAVHPDWTRAGVLREALTFRDHWHSTTKNPTKRDWLKTWRNWIRRAEKEPAR